MLNDIVSVQPMGGYRLQLRFEDGIEGEVDIATIISFDGIFAPLQEQAEFRKVSVDPELGTICWPNGADLDPDVLYARIAGEDISVSGPLEVPGASRMVPTRRD